MLTSKESSATHGSSTLGMWPVQSVHALSIKCMTDFKKVVSHNVSLTCEMTWCWVYCIIKIQVMVLFLLSSVAPGEIILTYGASVCNSPCSCSVQHWAVTLFMISF
jgi:hypothetical protein